MVVIRVPGQVGVVQVVVASGFLCLHEGQSQRCGLKGERASMWAGRGLVGVERPSEVGEGVGVVVNIVEVSGWSLGGIRIAWRNGVRYGDLESGHRSWLRWL